MNQRHCHVSITSPQALSLAVFNKFLFPVPCAFVSQPWLRAALLFSLSVCSLQFFHSLTFLHFFHFFFQKSFHFFSMLCLFFTFHFFFLVLIHFVCSCFFMCFKNMFIHFFRCHALLSHSLGFGLNSPRPPCQPLGFSCRKL